MHELAITEELVKVVDEARLGAGGDPRVIRVIIKLGRFTAVVPQYVEHYYNMLTEDTPMQGAELVFNEVPVVVLCSDCDKEFEVERAEFGCPSCGGANTDIISGREIFVESIEVADPEEE